MRAMLNEIHAAHAAEFEHATATRLKLLQAKADAAVYVKG